MSDVTDKGDNSNKWQKPTNAEVDESMSDKPNTEPEETPPETEPAKETDSVVSGDAGDEVEVADAGEGMHSDEQPAPVMESESPPDLAPASTPASTPESTATSIPERRGGRIVAWVSLLLAILGLAGAGYLYYLLVHLDPLGTLQQRAQSEQTKLLETRQAISGQMREQQAALDRALDAAAETRDARLATVESSVRESLKDALQAAPPSQREWKLAEAEYLLRIANHRVLMEQDSKGALQLLLAVDAIVEELDDFALHGLRARLADEIIALRQVPRDDLQGIYLRIEALKSQLDKISFAVPEFVADDVTLDDEQTVWQQVVAVFSGAFHVRSLDNDESFQPLLAPREEQYLELNLRLALEQAQLATLKRDQVVFEHALTRAQDWMLKYLKLSESENEVLLQELPDLLQMRLDRPLPDISGSLNELLSLRRGSS